MRLFPARTVIAVGILAAILVALAAALGGTIFEWIELPFWAPGFFAAAIVFPEGIHGNHALAYLGSVCVLNFIFTWCALLLIVKLAQRFSQKKSQG
jgi:hypothetical protein